MYLHPYTSEALNAQSSAVHGAWHSPKAPLAPGDELTAHQLCALLGEESWDRCKGLHKGCTGQGCPVLEVTCRLRLSVPMLKPA